METVSALLRSLQVRSLKEKLNLSVHVSPISALPHKQTLGGLGWDPLREEPATTELDWSFAPMPKSEERIARQNPCGPPPGFRPASSCSGIDRSVPGYHRSDYTGPHQTLPLSTSFMAWRLRACQEEEADAGYWFPFAFEVYPLKLATSVNSLGRAPKRKT